MSRFLCLAAASLFFVLSSSGQLTSVSVRWMDRGPEDPDSEISREVGMALIDNLQLRGINLDAFGLRLRVKAHSHFTPDGELVMISIVEGSGMSELRLEAGAKAQLSYAGQPLPENIEEARFVRETVTRDWLKQFVMIADMVQLIIPRENIQSEISRYVDELIHSRNCLVDDTCE